jgi:hypothetical protein
MIDINFIIWSHVLKRFEIIYLIKHVNAKNVHNYFDVFNWVIESKRPSWSELEK